MRFSLASLLLIAIVASVLGYGTSQRHLEPVTHAAIIAAAFATAYVASVFWSGWR